MLRTKIEKCPVCHSPELHDYLKTEDFSVTNEEYQLQECKICGLVLTQNHPVQDEIGKYYEFEEYISHTDTQEGLMNRLYHLARNFMLVKKRRIIEKKVKGGNLLDIGCGTGYFLNHMHENFWVVTGIEQDKDARKFGEEKFGLEVYGTEKLAELQDDTYDVITMWHVLEHVHNLDDYLNNIKRLLKDDGLLVLALPNKDSYDAMHYKEYWAAFDVPRHLWHFNIKSLSTLIERFGFNVEKIKAMPLDGAYISMLSEKHKGGGIMKGIFRGKMAWIKAKFKKKSASSLIYLIRKAG